MRPVIQSFKKIINEAPAGLAANANNVLDIATGVDSVAAGQTTAVDTNVPTGSVIKYIDIRIALQNLVNVAAFAHVALWLKRTGQGSLNPNTLGGNPLRNQVFLQDFFCIGQNQNVNRTYKFKVPKTFQRVRDGSVWQIIIRGDQVNTQGAQFIYKFYR